MQVIIKPSEYEFILKKALEKVEWDQAHGSPDTKHDLDRYCTGWTAEFSVMRMFGRESEMDWSIGPGRLYAHPDLPNGFGVKAVRCEWPFGEPGHSMALKAWLIPRNPTYPEVLCRVHDGYVTDVMGVVTPEEMIKYAADDLVIEADNPKKTGFDYWAMLMDGKELASFGPRKPQLPHGAMLSTLFVMANNHSASNYHVQRRFTAFGMRESSVTELREIILQKIHATNGPLRRTILEAKE